MDNPVPTVVDALGRLPSPNHVNPPSGAHAMDVDPPKRRPGRPRGSGKKSADISQHSTPVPGPPKIKRPVGRPRKDGFPAGSVGPRRSNRTSKGAADSSSSSAGPASVFPYSSTPPKPNFFPYAQSPWQTGYPTMQHTPPMAAIPVPLLLTPAPVGTDDWPTLFRNQPIAFLTNLVNALAAPNPISTGGQSVEESFKSHLVSLAPKGTQPIPALYSILKTFWLPSSPAYFSLTASASNVRTPSEHRFLYWDPQPLVFNGIACPSCSAPLLNRGRIRSGPIKVYDLEKPFFIIGCEYVCESPACIAQTSQEGRKYASTDASILRSLPTKLRDEFPAHLMQGDTDVGSGADVWSWKPMGVSRGLWNMVRSCLWIGLGKDAILHVVRSMQSGLSDEGLGREGEEGASAKEGGEERGHLLLEEETSRSEAEAAKGQIGDHTADAYNAWKANAALAASSPIMHHSEAGPSNAIVAASESVPGSHHGYGYVPGVASITYPFASYSYFPHGSQIQPQAQASSQPHSSNQIQSMPHPKTGQPSTLSMTTAASTSTIVPPVTSSPKQTKRPFDGVTTILEPAQKRTRHCCKCGSQDCKGKGGRAFCTNKCQDCGKLDCKGRNSRRPDKKCTEAWS